MAFKMTVERCSGIVTMAWLGAVLLIALLITAVAAEEISSPAAEELVANVRFKQDIYAASVASDNIENQPEHDMSGLTSAMKSQQDAGVAAAENVASHEEHDMSGLTSAMKSQQDAGVAAAENVASHEEHDMSGLTSAMKSQQDAGVAAAENILADDSHDSTGVSEAGKQTFSCAQSSIDSTVRVPELEATKHWPTPHADSQLCAGVASALAFGQCAGLALLAQLHILSARLIFFILLPFSASFVLAPVSLFRSNRLRRGVCRSFPTNGRSARPGALVTTC